MINVSWKIASVIAGSTRWRQPSTLVIPVVQGPNATTSPRPKLGSHLSVTAKTRMRRMPIKKVGSETPIRETVINACDMKVPRLSAE